MSLPIRLKVVCGGNHGHSELTRRVKKYLFTPVFMGVERVHCIIQEHVFENSNFFLKNHVHN